MGILRKLILIASIAAVAGCSTFSDIDNSTPEGSWKLANKYEADERYEEAIVEYTSLKNKHPYSKLATEAELKIADIHYKREEFVESQSAYQVFKEMHPSHPQADYVTFRLGMSFFSQLPSTIDRDLSVADRAILYFDEVVSSYPKSKYVSDAKEYKGKALHMLAEKEYYIGNFYFIRDHYESALGRFEDLLQKYPGSGLDAQALYGATMSAYKIKDLGKAKTYYQRLITDFRTSHEADKARRELGNNI